jgi:hypothetical protein
MTDKTEAMDNLIAQDADLIDMGTKRVAEVTEAAREVLIRISNSDDETAQRIRRGLIYTWEVGEIARHRQHGYDQGYYDGCANPIVRYDALREKINDIKEAWDWWQVDTYDRCASVVEDAINAALGQSK